MCSRGFSCLAAAEFMSGLEVLLSKKEAHSLMCLVNSKQALRLSDFAYNIVGSGLSLNGHLLASSPATNFRNETNE